MALVPARRRRGARAPLVALVGVVVAALLAGCTPDGEPPPQATVTRSAGPTQVTLAVYGPDAVISAYTHIASRFSEQHPSVSVSIRPYATRAEALRELRRSVGQANAPDIYLADQSDLPWLREHDANQRVDKMLGEKNVDFGDGYERIGLEAFSAADALQCMPVDVSPLVVYYNARLVRLDQLRPADEDPPSPKDGWRFQDFVEAARQASRGGARGVYVAPQVEQIAPFVFSDGGSVVDDPDDPTTMTLAEGSSADAMSTLLQLVRNPAYTFTAKQLRKKSALARFKAGRLGMILGHRDLTPQLRLQEGLTFGVMPIPRIGRTATTADISGLCVRPDLGDDADAVADLLAYLVSDDAMKTLAATGYVAPANSEALHSEDFVQSTRQPVGAEVSGKLNRFVRLLPEGPAWSQVRRTAEGSLRRLFYDPVIDPLDERLTAIDTLSEQQFGAAASPSGSPSTSPSGSVSPSPSTAGN